jgi:anti-sigma factor RsiW
MSSASENYPGQGSHPERKSHPEQSLLLRYIDGELPGRKARLVQRHLQACWECRTEVEEFQKTVADCIRYRKQVLAEALPAPPQEWRDIYREFDRIDAASPRRTFIPWRWGIAVATAALAVAGTAYYKIHEASVFNATVNKNLTVSSEIPEPLIRSSTESGAVSVEVPSRSAVPSRPAAIVPGTTASISDELQVLSVLHEIGADLGDPVQVSLSNNRVQVRGVGLAPARKREILAALEPLPNISAQFSDPPITPLPNDAVVGQPVTAATPPNIFQSRLEAQLGGRGLVDHLTGQILNWNEVATTHAYALRRLAQQFPVDASMSEQDRATLRGLVRDHLAALAAPEASFDQNLVPVLTGLGATSSSRAAGAASTWQAAAEQVFQAAQRIEVLSSVLLGVTPGESVHADLPSELLGAINDLRADLDQNQRLLGR